MMIDRYKLFIFDWDGTLSTSSWIVRIARLFKIRYKRANIEKNRQRYRVETVTELRRAEQVSKMYAFLFGVYSMFYRPRLKRGTVSLLKELKRRGKKIAIFSDSNRYRLLIETKKLGVVDYTDFVLSADSINRYKPNPTGIIAIIQRFRKTKKESLYIGDMAVDVYTARFAGIDSCAVAGGVDPYPLLKSVNPKYITRDLEEITRLK